MLKFYLHPAYTYFSNFKDIRKQALLPYTWGNYSTFSKFVISEPSIIDQIDL